MLIIRNVVFLCFLAITAALGQELSIDFSLNKKKYFQGEPILIKTNIVNKSYEIIGVCIPSDKALLFNIDSNAYVHQLLENFEQRQLDSQGLTITGLGPKYKLIFPGSDKIKCDIGKSNDAIIKSLKSYLNHAYYNCGYDTMCLYPAPNCFVYPIGRYRYDITVVSSAGGFVSSSYEFEIVAPTITQINQFKKAYSIFRSVKSRTYVFNNEAIDTNRFVNDLLVLNMMYRIISMRYDNENYINFVYKNISEMKEIGNRIICLERLIGYKAEEFIKDDESAMVPQKKYKMLDRRFESKLQKDFIENKLKDQPKKEVIEKIISQIDSDNYIKKYALRNDTIDTTPFRTLLK